MSSSLQEQILVVKQNTLFKNQPAWHGMLTDKIDPIISTIMEHQEYMTRSIAETDESYKQIIPYLIFTHNNKYFVMQRKATASEQRLAGKLSLGIGGHMQQQDMTSNNIIDWVQREFEEEVSYEGTLRITTLGILNDDSSKVGKVHLGLVLLAHGDNDNIAIKDEHKSGYLMTKAECMERYDSMESWSQMILDFLQ